VNVDQLLDSTRTERPPEPTPAPKRAALARIGIARDDAFTFYYEDNLAVLEEQGAELIEFSPLRDPLPGGLGGVYIGGGYPELFAAELEANAATRDAIRAFATAGRPLYAECGGLMYIGAALVVNGIRHEMCGALPVTTEFPGPLELAYCELTTAGGPFGDGLAGRGHWFHNGRALESTRPVAPAYEVELASGRRLHEGYSTSNTTGSWIHVHFRSCPTLARAFVDAAAQL
jgi:cobyrinic acid a,c-diamide synthase